MERSNIIDDIEQAMRTVGYTTSGYAVTLANMERNQADWAEGFSTMCIDEALSLTGVYSSFCTYNLQLWAEMVRRNIREVAIYIVGTVCRSLHLESSADDVCRKLSDAIYIDNYEPLEATEELKRKVSSANIDSFFKPHKSMTKPLPKECHEIVMKAKRELRRLFMSLADKLTKIHDEATRKEAQKLVKVTSWVKDFRSRKAEMKELYAEPMEESVMSVVEGFNISRSKAINMLKESLEGVLDDNPFYQLYEHCNHVETKFAAAVRRQSGSGQGKELDKFIEMMAKREWLEAALESDAASESDVASESDAVSKSEESSSSLVLTDAQQQAFELAVKRGYMSPNGDGTFKWKLRDVTLSYFLGRIFAGDYIHHDSKGDLWHKGDGNFPEKELRRLFSMKNIGSVRRGRLFGNLPEEYEKIESLIGEIE